MRALPLLLFGCSFIPARDVVCADVHGSWPGSVRCLGDAREGRIVGDEAVLAWYALDRARVALHLRDTAVKALHIPEENQPGLVIEDEALATAAMFAYFGGDGIRSTGPPTRLDARGGRLVVVSHHAYAGNEFTLDDTLSLAWICPDPARVFVWQTWKPPEVWPTALDEEAALAGPGSTPCPP